MKLYLVLIPTIFVVLLILNIILPNIFYKNNLNSTYTEKISSYECGFNPILDTRRKFSISYFLIALLYLIFDLEVILTVPFVTFIYETSLYGYTFIIIFIILLTVGFVYELNKNALDSYILS